MGDYLVWILISVFIAAGTIYLLKSRKRCLYIHDLQLFENERKVYENKAADFFAVPIYGRATFTSYAIRKKTHIIITDRRIIAATRMLFSNKYLITHMLWFQPDDSAVRECEKMSGGLFSIGYLNFLVSEKNIRTQQDKQHAFLEIVPEKTKSAVNTENFRLYADRLPSY